MKPFGFDKLPEVVRQLFEKVEHLEEMILKLQPEQQDKVELLSIEEAAEYLNVTVAALYSMTSRRLVPFNKPGKRLYFLKNDLDQWVKSAKVKTQDELWAENKSKFRR
jgi:excisionase family DNA binding protein